MAPKVSKFLKNWRKRKMAVLICLIIVGMSVGATVLHHSRVQKPAADAPLYEKVVNGFGHRVGNFVGDVERFLLDTRFKDRGEIQPSGKIGVLAIDEKSIQKFGRWPFPRDIYDQAFANLKKAGVEWVGFDVVWSEPQRPLLKEAMDEIASLQEAAQSGNAAGVEAQYERLRNLNVLSEGDQAFIEMLGNYPEIILGYFFHFDNKVGEESYPGLDTMLDSAVFPVLPDGVEANQIGSVQRPTAIVPNIPAIAESGSYFAFFNNDPDPDAIVRWVTMFAEIDGNLMPSLSLRTAANMMGRMPILIAESETEFSLELVNEEDDTDVIKIPLDPKAQGRMLLNHYGAENTLKHFSIADAYDDSFTDEERATIKGMSLLLGPTAIGINDMRANPFSANIMGVENHAAAVDNIVSQNFMMRSFALMKFELWLIIIVGLLFTPIVVFSRAVTSGVAVVLFLAGYYFFDRVFLFGEGQWVYMGMPFMQILSMYIATTFYKYLTEEREKKKVRGTFSMYLNPDVVEEMLDSEGEVSLKSETKELTVFFSDVRDFTSMSERLTAEQLSELMNDYFDPMTRIVLDSKGCLDKYIGDAAMAFWNAPVEVPNHPDVAVQACVDMLLALDEVNAKLVEKKFPTVDLGMGLNTGPMSVGNMGSSKRFAYTVLGDHVNLGARLEALTKGYGVKVMISENTYSKLQDPNKYFIRCLDKIRVKGKKEGVTVYEVIRPDLLKTEAAIRNYIGEFEEGLRLYWDQDWDKAKKHFTASMLIRQGDKAAENFLERIAAFEQAPPQDQWDGVYTFTSKS